MSQSIEHFDIEINFYGNRFEQIVSTRLRKKHKNAPKMIGAPNKSLIESHNNNEKEIKEINNNFEIIHRRLQKQDQYSSAGQQGQEGAAWVYCGICLLTGAGQPKGQPNPDLGIQYLERAIDEFQSLDATKCLASYLSQKDAADPRALELFHQLADTYGSFNMIFIAPFLIHDYYR